MILGGNGSVQRPQPTSARRINARRALLAAARIDWHLTDWNLVVLILQPEAVVYAPSEEAAVKLVNGACGSAPEPYRP